MKQLTILIILLVSLGFNMALYQKASDLEDTPSQIYKLTQKVKLRDQQILRLTKELEKYEVTYQWLIKLGASPEEALETIKAAEVHGVSPKSMAP